MSLMVNEVFKSLQGESSYAGLPCLFIRLTGCNLRCLWCDSDYSYTEGNDMSSGDVAGLINSSGADLIEFTGGEPLLQKDALIEVINIVDSRKTILLETNGSISLEGIPDRVVKIVDIKLKGSGEGSSFLLDNLKYIRKKDEIKFVLTDIIDYNEFRGYYTEHKLSEKCLILVSRVKDAAITDREIADKILKDGLKVKYQIQLHKYIWNDERGR